MQQTPFESIQNSPLYSPDLAPTPAHKRTWGKWNLAALWVGMAVCIPTYMLASYMTQSGLSWVASLIIIGLANLVITVPMILNGQAGVQYGIPFPVQGRAAFGTRGVHLPSFLRAMVACGWFGVQTWIGGLALYSIFNAITGTPDTTALSAGKFIAFGIFWLINIYFIWKGTESIKWLEDYSAPILILIGIILIGWGYQNGGGFANVLNHTKQMGNITAQIIQSSSSSPVLILNPLKNHDNTLKTTFFKVNMPLTNGTEYSTDWGILPQNLQYDIGNIPQLNTQKLEQVTVEFKNAEGKTTPAIPVKMTNSATSNTPTFWSYVLWFTAMVGFWATMSISISDITRFAKTQNDQIVGQLIGLPPTMMFYSFVGIFVTSAAVIAFKDVQVVEQAPWDPVSLVSKFNNPLVVVFAQLAMIIATLSTNIAANVIAPAYTFSNMFPQKISFKMGGIIAGIIGILICPWWLMDSISSILLFVSALLGPILGILLCDYFLIRKKQLNINELFNPNGIYTYQNGINIPAFIATALGILVAIIGKFIPALNFLFTLSWFVGFAVAFAVYYFLMKKNNTLAAQKI